LTVRVSAPGKVVLLGEYAVLEGAPALVMAVNRRARVTVSPRDGPYCSVTAPGWQPETVRFRLAAGEPEWLVPDGRCPMLADHALRAFFDPERLREPCRPFHLELDSTALAAAGRRAPVKLGLGSSAAVTVALCYALGYYVALQKAGVAPFDLRQLIEIHAGFQGRRGSGLDIAASLYGGLIEFKRAGTPEVRPSQIPSDLAYTFIWSGRQAATGQFLARLECWRRDDEPGFSAALRPLLELAESGAQSARCGDAEDYLRVVTAYADALERLGAAAATDIISGPHRRLRTLAARCGVVYKSCGAGGGDIGVAMGRDDGALARFENDAAAEGFEVLSLQIDQKGVQPPAGN